MPPFVFEKQTEAHNFLLHLGKPWCTMRTELLYTGKDVSIWDLKELNGTAV